MTAKKKTSKKVVAKKEVKKTPAKKIAKKIIKKAFFLFVVNNENSLYAFIIKISAFVSKANKFSFFFFIKLSSNILFI